MASGQWGWVWAQREWGGGGGEREEIGRGAVCGVGGVRCAEWEGCGVRSGRYGVGGSSHIEEDRDGEPQHADEHDIPQGARLE